LDARCEQRLQIHAGTAIKDEDYSAATLWARA
jgi:hypothetical protein